MATFSISSFTTFAGLLVAARKLATDPDPIDRRKALAALASDGRALAAALRECGLAPLAREMAVAAEQAVRMTHPGPAIDDARAIFWQVAPEALADPAIFAAANLDAKAATDAMVAAIRASGYGRDFVAHALAEPYFREVARLALDRMLQNADSMATLAPGLWRQSLQRQGVAVWSKIVSD